MCGKDNFPLTPFLRTVWSLEVLALSGLKNLSQQIKTQQEANRVK